MVVAYAVIVGAFIYRKLKRRRIPDILFTAGLESAMVMLLLGLSEPFSWVIASEEVPQTIINGIGHISTSPYVVLLLINLLRSAVSGGRCLLQPSSGLITPPVGAVLFSICSISGMSLDKLSRGIWPPFFISLAILALITYMPSLTTFLPHPIMK